MEPHLPSNVEQPLPVGQLLPVGSARPLDGRHRLLPHREVQLLGELRHRLRPDGRNISHMVNSSYLFS